MTEAVANLPHTEQLIESNEPRLDEIAPPNHRTIESIWPKHECGKSESAAAISACACGAAVGMLVVFGLCNNIE